MRLGIGPRIAIGYGICLLLLVTVTLVGVSSITRTTAAYHAVVVDLNARVIAALEARGSAYKAAVSYLRYRETGQLQYLTDWHAAEATAQQEIAAVRDASRGTATEAWGQALTLLSQWQGQAVRSDAAAQAGQRAQAARILTTELFPAQDELQTVIAQQVSLVEANAAARDSGAASRAARWLWTMVAAAILALAAGIVAAWTLTRAISGNLREAIGTLASAAAEMLAATAQQAAGAAEEAAAVQETSATVEEVKQTVQVSADKAKGVMEASQRADQASADGRRAVAQMIQRIQDVRKQMEGLATRIVALSEQSQAIGEITTTVNDLAEQSNLLAVNAAIEAAKAGEAGKGFGVVAGEVKSLAEQSKHSTAQVRGILADVLRATQAAVMAVEQVVKTAEAGEAVAVQSGEAIQLLATSVTASTQMAHRILASAQQQVVGVEQIGDAMRNIEQSSTQNMASTRQVERTAQNIDDLAGRLGEILGRHGDPGGPAAAGMRSPISRMRPQ